MIVINKEEKMEILERYPDVHVVRTSKQKSKRHRYYIVEEPEIMACLKGIRSRVVPEVFE